MQTKTIREERILEEIRDLPDATQEKLEKLIRFFKREIIDSKKNEDEAIRSFFNVCGTWEDSRSAEEIIREVYEARKSRNGSESQL